MKTNMVKFLTPQEAVTSFNEDERRIYDKWREMFEKKSEGDIFWHYNLGHEAVAVREVTMKQEGTVYGAKLLQRLAWALGMQSETPIENAMRVVECWPTKTELMEYVKLRGSVDNQLCWTHLVLLTAAKDEAVRLQLASATLEQGWSSQRLGQELQALKELEDSRTRRTGRPVKVPSNLGGCLTHMGAMFDKSLNLCTAWMGNQFDFRREFETTPPDRVDEDLRNRISAARAKLDALLQAFTQAKAGLDDIYVKVEQQQMGAKAATNGEDDDPRTAEEINKEIQRMAGGRKSTKPAKKATRKRPGIRR